MNTPDQPTPETLTSAVAVYPEPPPHSIIIAGPTDLRIIIDLQTGAITHEGYTPDEAAQEFWKAIITAFPSVRDQIIGAYQAEQAAFAERLLAEREKELAAQGQQPEVS